MRYTCFLPYVETVLILKINPKYRTYLSLNTATNYDIHSQICMVATVHLTYIMRVYHN